MNYISKLFKSHKDKIVVPNKDWSDITIEKFYKIQEILEVQDEYMLYNLIDCIWDVDSQSMDVATVSRYANKLNFIKDEPKSIIPRKEYKLNGRVYENHYNLTTMTTAQFIDFNNYSKEGKMENCLSVIIIPKGHQYNDGYDIGMVIEDIKQMDIQTAKTIAFFLQRQSEMFIRLFQYYLIQKVKKTKMDKTEKKQLIDQLRKIDFNFLVSFPTLLSTLKNYQHQ